MFVIKRRIKKGFPTHPYPQTNSFSFRFNVRIYGNVYALRHIYHHTEHIQTLVFIYSQLPSAEPQNKRKSLNYPQNLLT